MKHFEEVLKSLGAKTTIALRESKNWTLWEAEYVTPISTIKGTYLYLKASCPLSEATPANLTNFRALSNAGEYQVVVTPKSDLAKDLNATKARFKGVTAGTTQQLLQDHLLKDITYKPLEKEDHFIPPSISLANDQLETDGLQFLSNWLVGAVSGVDNTPLALLAADGGIGKTTLARELCDAVRAKYPRVLPLLIQSDQWKNISNTGFTLDTLWDIAIARRLDNCNSLRSNHSALRVLMQEGLLVVIFDGFDELAAASDDATRPQEILSELQNLFTPEDEDAGAKIILTSRTTYWKAIESNFNTTAKQIEVFRLNGFNNHQRKAYFDSRLSNEKDRDTAMRIARQISGPLVSAGSPLSNTEELNKDRLSGTPFVLALIARYVEDTDEIDLNPYGSDPLEPLLLGVCRRENIRQELKIAPETQLAIFEEIFRLEESTISKQDIDFVLEVFDVTDPDVRRRFLNHFFLQHVHPGSLSARFEILKVYFVSRFLAKGLQKLYSTTPEREIALTLSRHFMGESQVVEWLVWQFQKLPRVRVLQAIHHASEIINTPKNLPSRVRASIALSRIVFHLITGQTKVERAADLCELFSAQVKGGSKVLRGATISGRVRSIDFSKFVFEQCSFIDTDFVGCKFSASTVFDGCYFEGTLDFSGCEDIASAIERESSFSPDAEITWSRIFATQPSAKVRMEFAEEALIRALKKFKGDYGFHGIQYRRRNNASNPRNPYNSSVWEALKHRAITETHTISNVSEGGLNIKDDKSLRREIGQYLDNGIVGPTLQVVISDLVNS